MFKDIIDPNPIYIFLLFRVKETSKAFNCIIFEAAAELVSVRHI